MRQEINWRVRVEAILWQFRSIDCCVQHARPKTRIKLTFSPQSLIMFLWMFRHFCGPLSFPVSLFCVFIFSHPDTKQRHHAAANDTQNNSSKKFAWKHHLPHYYQWNCCAEDKDLTPWRNAVINWGCEKSTVWPRSPLLATETQIWHLLPRVYIPFHSYESKVYQHLHCHANQAHFHVKSFARRLVIITLLTCRSL